LEESAGTWPKLGPLASAERQQHFFAERVFKFLKVQRGLAFVTQHFEYRRTAFFGYFDSRILQVHHVHLKRFHEKILAVSTTGTRQGHALLLTDKSF
jgi:hypothetical protein